MRVVLDTNILVSALLTPLGRPAAICRMWEEKSFKLLVCAELIDELRVTLRKPRIAVRIKPYRAGHLINQLKDFAESIDFLPRVARSSDSTDDFLLALAEKGRAEYLVTGDKSGLLVLATHKTTRIVNTKEFIDLFPDRDGYTYPAIAARN